jgi:branched-chain amino acid transport system substrate-binding protein
MLLVLVTLGLALAQCGPQAFQCTDAIGCVDIAPNDPIHIAYMMVVTGPDESLGLDTKYGVEIAIDDKGEVLGHKILLTGEDSQCNAEGGQAAATKIAADKTIVGIVGTNCSSEARPAAPIITQAGMVMVSPSNTAPDLTDPAKHQAGYLRTAHNDIIQGAAMAKFAYEKGFRKAATIHDGSIYADQLQQVFAAEFVKLGGTITAQEAVAPTDTDMKPVLTRIAATQPDLIYYPIFIAAGGFITSQARQTPGLENTALSSADGTFSPDLMKAAGEAAVGMYHSSPDFAAFGDAYKQFLAKYEAKYGRKVMAPFHGHAYDATMLIFTAIEKVAVKDADGTLHIGRQALRDALFATKDYKGLTGNLTCNANGDCADPKIAVYEVKDANPDNWDPGVNPVKIWP